MNMGPVKIIYSPYELPKFEKYIPTAPPKQCGLYEQLTLESCPRENKKENVTVNKVCLYLMLAALKERTKIVSKVWEPCP